MPRPSKTQLAQRKETEIRVNKAKEAILEEFSRLLTRHLPSLIKREVSSTSQLFMIIADGQARLQFKYQTEVTDGASCVLDDGEQDLPLQQPSEFRPAETPAPSAPATPATTEGE